MQNILNQINIRDLVKLFNIQIAIAIFLIFLIFRGVFSHVIVKIFLIFTKKNKKEIKIKETSGYKILCKFFAFLGMYLSIRMFKLSNQALANVNTIFEIICIILTTSLITSTLNKDFLVFKSNVESSQNDVFVNLISRVVKFFIWMIAVYIIIKMLGYDLTGLMAGLGVGSVIISLAAQDTVKSLLSGAVILTDKPFEIGDFIEVGNHKGTVIDITFRSTRIKAADNSIITIPNSTVTSESVVNWNKLKTRRFEFSLNLSMDTTSEKIQYVLKKIRLVLKNNPKVLPETVQVNFDSISSYSNDIKIFLYINETNYYKFLNEKEKIYCDILNLVEMENIDLAYPTQTVYVKNQENTAKLDSERKNEE